MTDKEYFKLWHLAQQLRDMYDPNYSPEIIIGCPPDSLFFTRGPYAIVDHNDKRPMIKQIIGEFLKEFNRRHTGFIYIDEYLQ